MTQMAPEPVNVTPTGTPAQPTINITTPPAQPQQYFTAADLEAARQQEKDKLYGRIDGLEKNLNEFKTEVDTLRTEREAAQADAQAKADALAEAARKEEEGKLSVQELLDKRDKDWQTEKADLVRQMELERAVAQKDRELFTLQSFIQRRVAEEIAADTIIPDLVEFIGGNNEAEVEASITRVKEKTANIIAGATRMNSGIPSSPPVAPGVSPTGFAPTGPLDTITGQQTYTAEDIQKMDAAQYRAFRAQVGIDKAGNNTGMFN